MPIFDHYTLILEREDIENMDFTVIKDYMSNFDFNEMLIYENRNRLDISVHGYDKDKRELFEIFEVVNWFRQSAYEENIPWFLLLCTNFDSQSIKLLTSCFISEPVKGEDGLWHFILNRANLKEFAVVNFGVMNNFFKEKNLAQSVNDEISNEVNRYMDNWLGLK